MEPPQVISHMWNHLSHARVLKQDKLYIYIALLLYIEHCFTKVKILHFIYIYIYSVVSLRACSHRQCDARGGLRISS